ncbi:MAG: cupin domain-containing protein [Dehalococcoidia bacterium]|nr:cupin domain-containing protein [Dehalococcoidia bacterium]
MLLIKKGEGEPYEAKRHFNCWSMLKLIPDKNSRRLNIGLSYFLPNGGAEMAASPLERAYYVISGSLRVKGKTEEYILQPGDLFYIGAGEEREIRVVGTDPANILVIMTKVD